MRYWRLVGIRSLSNLLTLTELSLFDGSITYSAPMLSGQLGSSFSVDWDFGLSANVVEIRLRGDVEADFPFSMTLQSSTDGLAWSTVSRLERLVFPGAGELLTVAANGSSGLAPIVFEAIFTNSVIEIQFASPVNLPLQPVVSIGLSRVPGRPSGSGRIAGTVKEKSTPVNTPLARRVVLLDLVTQELVDETISDAVTGEYAFENINQNRRYVVISYDDAGLYRAVIADNLQAEPMP